MVRIIIIYISLITFSGTILSQPKYNTGLKFDDDKYNKTLMKAPLTRSLYGASLPSSASLKKFAPNPDSQGSYGTCVGWSSAYCAMTIVQAKKNKWNEKSTITSNAFSPGFTYKLIKSEDDYNCQLGSNVDDALNLFKTMGTVKYSDMNQSCPGDIPSNLLTIANNYKIKDYAKLFGVSDMSNLKIENTKKSLSEGKPVVIGMKCPDSFMYASGCWAPTEDPNGNFGGHALCVIGYDNNMYGGAFEIQNSWGADWGNKGYIWIKYNDYANFTRYAYEIIDDFGTNPSGEVSLSGSVSLVRMNGEEMKASLLGNYYYMNGEYRSGTKFRLYISNNEPAFVYAFGSDNTNKTYQVFPHLPGISPALTYKQNNVAIPDEDHFIEMDNTIGMDYLCVLYSLNPLDINDIRKKVENAYGSFDAKVQSVLGNEMVPFSKTNYSHQEISFKTQNTSKTVVALIVETKHVP